MIDKSLYETAAIEPGLGHNGGPPPDDLVAPQTSGSALAPGKATAASLWAVKKQLYRTGEAKTALGVGTTKLYQLINNGTLDARRLGKLTYITGDSIEAFVASLPRAETPTMVQAKHDKWAGQRRSRAKTQEAEPGAAE